MGRSPPSGSTGRHLLNQGAKRRELIPICFRQDACPSAPTCCTASAVVELQVGAPRPKLVLIPSNRSIRWHTELAYMASSINL